MGKELIQICVEVPKTLAKWLDEASNRTGFPVEYLVQRAIREKLLDDVFELVHGFAEKHSDICDLWVFRSDEKTKICGHVFLEQLQLVEMLVEKGVYKSIEHFIQTALLDNIAAELMHNFQKSL